MDHSFGLYPQKTPGSQVEISKDALASGIQLIDQSQSYLRTIMLGLALQYKSLSMEREALMGCQEAGPDPVNVQAAASLVTLCALFGFQRQTQNLAAQAAQAGGVCDQTDVNLGAVSILVTMMRLLRLFGQKGENELEELDDPIV